MCKRLSQVAPHTEASSYNHAASKHLAQYYPADTFIQKTKKLFQDTRSQRNMAALTADLSEVHSIMSRNIAEVLGQGEKLDSECQQQMPQRQRVASTS